MLFLSFALSISLSWLVTAAILPAVPAAQAFTGTASVADAPFDDPARFHQQLETLPSLGNPNDSDGWRAASRAKGSRCCRHMVTRSSI